MKGQRVAARTSLGARRSAVSPRVVLGIAVLAILLGASSAQAASPEPVGDPDITMTAQPLLGGTVRPGAWLAVRVALANSGPAVDAELRLSTPGRVSSNYSIPVQLAAGARQEHFLYAPTGLFMGRVQVDLVNGDRVFATAPLALANRDPEALYAFIVADRPEALVRPIRQVVSATGRSGVEVVAIGPEDLPGRLEAWTSIDLLVWQDVDSTRLEAVQLEALNGWLALGGDLLIFGGTAGSSVFSGFPAVLLPYRPSTTVVASPADLEALTGGVMTPATDSPAALAGPLDGGELLGGTPGSALAARREHGLGTVTLIGLDPTGGWLDGAAEEALWRSAVPAGSSAPGPKLPADDAFLVSSLGNVPSVQLPRGDHLFLLILAYIVAIGPLNYFILRRRDKREWAWLTIPLTIGGFALAGYILGVELRGGSVVVHELAIVQGAAGTEHGLADAHVAIYSPSRTSFDVKVGGAPLLGVPSTERRQSDRPLDVLLGDPATLRNYDIGFGVLRSFRASAQVSTPRLETDLSLVNGTVAGSVTNMSADTLVDVSFVYAGAVQRLGDLAPGASRSVNVRPAEWDEGREDLSSQMYGWEGEPRGAGPSIAYRRAVIRHLSGGWDSGMNGVGVFSHGPMILAWVSQPVLEVDLGSPAQQVAETLYLLAARAELERGEVVFSGSVLAPSSVAVDAAEGWAQGGGWFSLQGGTITMDYRPPAFEGTFLPSSMLINLGAEGTTGRGEELLPLPADQQPDPEAPLATVPRPGVGGRGIPRLQFFDRLVGTWVEFEALDALRTYLIPEPGRYVDSAGTFRVRFVVGHDDYADFRFTARLEGTVE